MRSFRFLKGNRARPGMHSEPRKGGKNALVSSPGIKPGEPRDQTGRAPGSNRASPGIKPGEPRNQTGPWDGRPDLFINLNWLAWVQSRQGGRFRFINLKPLSLWRVFPVSVLCWLQASFRGMPKNWVFRRPADSRAWR